MEQTAQNTTNTSVVLAGIVLNFLGLVLVAYINVKGNRKVDKAVENTEKINSAVNDVPKGTPTLSKRMDDSNTKIDAIEVGVVEAKKAASEAKKIASDTNLVVKSVEQLVTSLLDYVVRRQDAEQIKKEVKEVHKQRKQAQREAGEMGEAG